MPNQVRFVSPRNSADYDRLVTQLLEQGLGAEQVYGGCGSEERADAVRAKVRTAARKQGYACKAYWQLCGSSGKCAWGDDCTHHVNITLYDMQKARDYRAKQPQRHRR